VTGSGHRVTGSKASKSGRVTGQRIRPGSICGAIYNIRFKQHSFWRTVSGPTGLADTRTPNHPGLRGWRRAMTRTHTPKAPVKSPSPTYRNGPGALVVAKPQVFNSQQSGQQIQVQEDKFVGFRWRTLRKARRARLWWDAKACMFDSGRTDC